MKFNNNNHSITQLTQLFEFLTRSLHGRLLIFLAVTAVFVFLPVLVSKSVGSNAEDEYNNFYNTSSGFYVVVSYKNFDDATALVDRLRAQGYDPFSKTVNIPNKGEWRRVYVKRYENNEEALLDGNKLIETGVFKDFFVLLVKPKPEDKKGVPRGNADADKEDKKNIFPPPTLIKKKILMKKKNPVVPPVTVSTKEKPDIEKPEPQAVEEIPPPPTLTTQEILAKIEIPVVPASTKEKIEIPIFPPVIVSTKDKPDIEKTEPEKTEPEKTEPEKTEPEKTEPEKTEPEKTEPPTIEEIPLPHKADKPDTGLNTGGNPYDRAMIDFTAGRYEDALDKFKAIIKTEKNEAAMRRIADCYYFLGEKGDRRYFSEAIDQYRNIIRIYPGSKEENAQAIYRRAQSARRLNLYYEALMDFKNLSSRFPESGYFPESLYMIGKMYYKTENFNEAIMNFKEYIKRFPDGEHLNQAYFGVGDCYFQIRQFTDADVWYNNALKRWPALEDIPEDTFFTLGSHHFQAGKYNDALRVLFVYLNLFPDGKNSRNALYTIARSFEEMDQLPQALKMLSQVLERYPESMEARKSEFNMANIGVKDPEIKLPDIFYGMDYYRNPIEAYDKIREKLYDFDREEELIFQKASALMKKKRYKEAFDNGRFLLDKFPRGKYRKEGEKNLILSAEGLIDDYYSEKDYLAVSEVYFNSDRKVLFGNGNFDLLFKIGTSLEKIDLSDHAARVFEEMITVFAEDKRVNALSLAIAKIDDDKKRYENAKKRLKDLLEKRPDVDKKTAMTARQLLGDICYKEGLFKEAVSFYLEVLDTPTGVADHAAIRKKYADSLKGLGLYSAALINYKKVLENCNDLEQKCPAPVIMGSYEGAADCLYSQGDYQQAILMYEQSLKSTSEDKQDMWAKFNIGRGYAKLDNKPMADESFSSLKMENNNEFWPRVIEYYTADKTLDRNMREKLESWGIKN